jgi:2-(3-amino-3-carboxypropyl)histidine synthase
LKVSCYDINLEEVVQKIKEKNYKKILLQIPEGLKTYSLDFVSFLEKKVDAEFIVFADPCFGACDVVCSDIRDIGVDFIVQIGHLPIPSLKDMSPPTLFVNAFVDFDVEKLVKKIIPKLDSRKIGLVTTAQHVNLITVVEEALSKQDFEVFVSEGDRRIDAKGQILGCNFSSANTIKDDVDMFLFIGSGTFHAMGLILSTKKPVVSVDPYTFEVKKEEIDELKDMVLKQRYGAIASSRDARTFGILVGLKKGQRRMDLAEDIKRIIESKDRKAIIFAMSYFSSFYLEGIRGVDCFISTSCPRIAIDDYMQYKIPIITPVELKILLGLKKWDDFKFDEILE